MADSVPSVTEGPGSPSQPFTSGVVATVPKHFRYPNGVGKPPFDKWIFFEAKAGRHVVRNVISPEGIQPDSTISDVSLYLDDTVLNTTLEMRYEQTSLGPFYGAILEQLAQGASDLSHNILTPGTDFGFNQGLKDLVSTAEKYIGSYNKGNFRSLAGLLFNDVVTVATQAQSATSILTGNKPNPRTDILFDTQSYRTHTMSFLMVPRSLDEAQMIDNIVHFFQYYMLPEYINPGAQGEAGSYMIGFPYEFNITCRRGDVNNNTQLEHINKFARSVLKTVTVDHAVNEKTAFIKDDTGAFWPVATNLTLIFQEVVLLDRNSPEITRAGTQLLPNPKI